MGDIKKVNVLFELGTEELPATAVQRFPEQLEQLLTTALNDQQLSYKTLHIYITPRRIAISIHNLLAKQPDSIVEKQGPQEKVAFNDKDEATPAALGFARSNNIDASDLKKYIEKGRLVYRFNKPGIMAEELLPTMLTDAINKLQSGRTMQWGSGTQKFVRPIRWVMLLVDDKKVKDEIFGLPIQDFTYGHRFLSPEKIKIKNADSYVKQLKTEGKVMVDPAERKKYILDQLHALPKKHHATALIDEALVDEVAGLVEWPTALMASFRDDFLHVPAEALISSMKQHQKCFPLLSESQELLPYFIFISNLESKNPKQVIQGNERVMHARLSDAAFFFIKDKQEPLAERLMKLSSIVYQEKLGSLYDKTQRLVSLCEQLGDTFQLDQHDAVRAAWLSLCDLSTAMVQEFPELQGIMGYHYANHDGEPATVCTALAEQYLPRFSGDQLPETLMGCVLAIAQRLDTLVGQFSIGNKPTGDKDPFALRRVALGLLRILIEKNLDIDLKAWFTFTIGLLPVKVKDADELSNDIWKFCLDRLKAFYTERGFNVSDFNAVAKLNISNPYDFNLRLLALQEFHQLPAATALIAAHKRVKNILAKTDNTDLQVKAQLLAEPAEIKLANAINDKLPLFQQLSQQRDYVALLNELASLRPFIDGFFDHVMVMVDDMAVRENRLALLSQLCALMESVAEISQLE